MKSKLVINYYTQLFVHVISGLAERFPLVEKGLYLVTYLKWNNIITDELTYLPTHNSSSNEKYR